jgi:RimJ/RimL family protein N-acetyltransferase
MASMRKSRNEGWRVSDLPNWRQCSDPDLKTEAGRYVRIDRAQFPGDEEALFAAIGGSGKGDLWKYIPIGPFDDAQTLGATLKAVGDHHNWRTHILRAPETGETLGMASYMRIRPEAGSAEVGCIVYAKKLQRTPAATEAMYLMAKHVFEDLGYRRYEWKCDNANEASKRAALRLGFTFEGVFRQDMVVKGCNRDTAWFSILDTEWPVVKLALETWLAEGNFDGDGGQRRSLKEIRAAL